METTLKHGGGGGEPGVVKDHTLEFLFFGPFPYSVEMTTFFQRTFGDNITYVRWNLLFEL